MSLLNQTPLFLGAYLDDQLVGGISGFATGGDTFRIRGVIVVPPARRKGIGAALLARLTEMSGDSSLFWTAPRQENLEFYQKLGFVKVSDWTHELFHPGPNCFAVRAGVAPARQNQFEPDAYSSGQVLSKIWLCEELEKCAVTHALSPRTIWHLCGWNGVLPFLLFSRGRLAILKIRSFDIDAKAVLTADQFLNAWEWQAWMFKAICADIHYLDYENPGQYHSERPDVVINCALEHLSDQTWWEKIPIGTTVVLQGTDMKNHDHVVGLDSAADILSLYPCREVYFNGAKLFQYDSGFSFSRFMIIGKK